MTPQAPKHDHASAHLPTRALTLRAQNPQPRWRRFASNFVALMLIWLILTDFRLDALVFGIPAVFAGSALVFLTPSTPRWRLSPYGAGGFVIWFAIQSVRGAVDVAWRAFSPALPLQPGFGCYSPALPEGAPRILFVNTITLLPGTLSAEISGSDVIVHMLDKSADLQADLRALELRVAALFGLSPDTEVSG